MSLNLKAAILAAGLMLIASVLRLLKKHSIHPSFGVLWLAVGLFLATMPLLERIYAHAARTVLGLYGGDHLIYISMIAFLLAYGMYLTARICEMSDRISKLISFTAVLESEVRTLREDLRKDP